MMRLWRTSALSVTWSGINGDGQSMMKYISTALDLVPDLEIFGSPWSPPAWMKQNNTTLNGIGDGINKWEERTAITNITLITL